MSKIEWTSITWNPVTGCSKVSPGCKNCYAERMANRLKLMGLEKYSQGFKVKTHNDVLDYPFTLKKSKIIFVNSMSDLFHDDVPDSFIKKVFEVMNHCPQHIFQVLTKRSERLAKIAPELNWTQNIWMGVSVENQDYTFRIQNLTKTKARVKFLSIEPLIGPINKLPLSNIDWVIVGGESGPGARTIEEEWVIKIKNKCEQYGVPFFFKQWGGVNKKKNGRKLLNKEWNQMPA